MPVSEKIYTMMREGSWIRKMFEAGEKLRAESGGADIMDFSLGNPDIDPPSEFFTALKEVCDLKVPFKHGYMSNAGYKDVRIKVAERISSEQRVDVDFSQVVMSCGAGGALNIALKTIINPGDSVLAVVPCFMEYKSYAENHGGTLRLVQSKGDFNLDLSAIEKAIDLSTAALIINSPNNPSGVVYPEETLSALGKLLEEKSKILGRTVYLISDEPYRRIVYDKTIVPSIFKIYKNSIIVTSYSKELSVPGERIGWAAINSRAEDREDLAGGMALCNRVLGYINAPAIMQRVIERIGDAMVPVELYRERRDLLCGALKESGYEFLLPQGTFYCFPKAPGGDDIAFVDELRMEKILTVPGRGFGLPGYFRIAFCVDAQTIVKALPGFRRAAERIRGAY